MGEPDERLMTRGRFLGLAGAGSALGTIGAVVLVRKSVRQAQPGDVERVIRDGLPYLDLQVSEEEFRGFGEMFLERVPFQVFQEPREMLLATFLLSTDFFVNGADASRPVRFVQYHDPYISPCWNPVVRQDPGP